MNIHKLILLGGVAAAAVALIGLAAAPSGAAECQSFDAVLADGQSMGMLPFVIPADRLPAAVKQIEGITGHSFGDVSRGFMVLLGTKDSDGPLVATFGFEVGGCMLEPQTVPYTAIVKQPGLPV